MAHASDLTVIVPAYNEADTIAETLVSLYEQTCPPREVIVADDCSTDDTAAIARSLGATVVLPPANTGSKAGAQTFALDFVTTGLTMAVDADTTLAPDGIERLLGAFDDPEVRAASGTVLPRRVRSVWERGRYIEYMFAFSFFKRVQDHYERPLISSGCFSIYRTRALRDIGGWSMRTMAEDMDLTWTFYQRGWGVRFVPDAVCFPVEPHDLHFLRKQLRRWSHGFVQNVKLHWRGLLHAGYLRSVVAVAFWDAVVASLVYLMVLPVLAVLVSPLVLLAYVLDGPLVLIPVAIVAYQRRELGRALASFPAYFALRLVNSISMLSALWCEFVLRRPLLVYEKGH